jgi:hypothetical protein
MPLTVRSSTGHARTKARPAPKREPQNSEYIIGEINAFIAIRDELLAEAEESKTVSKLESLLVANNFVESCLSPARSPYDVQVLPESAANRERQRCEQVKRRVADLRDQFELR